MKTASEATKQKSREWNLSTRKTLLARVGSRRNRSRPSFCRPLSALRDSLQAHGDQENEKYKLRHKEKKPVDVVARIQAQKGRYPLAFVTSK